jgi:hypothetical protein
MNEVIITGIIGLGIFVGFSIYAVVKIQAIQKMSQTRSAPLLGVVMPQATSSEEKRDKNE